MRRKAVVTGIGAITSLGGSLKTIWGKILEGESGISAIQNFDTKGLDATIGGEIIMGEGSFDPKQKINPVLLRKLDLFSIYGLYAAIQAFEDAGLGVSDFDKKRAGVLVGSGIGGIKEIYLNAIRGYERGMNKLSPFFIPKSLINMLSGHISQYFGFQGHIGTVAAACATGACAIGDALRVIQRGDADIMLCGGAEGALDAFSMGGFSACGALSKKFNDTPSKASRPWDQDRDGFVMSDGACILVLEEKEFAKKRGAKIYGEVLGYGVSSDAYHMTSPPEDGRGASLSMEMALSDAQITPHQVGYINAHATSTVLGDKAEIEAIRVVFKDCLDTIKISGTKSCTGHLLGAAGSLEAAFCLMALQEQVVPPTINLEKPDEKCKGLNLVANIKQSLNAVHALSNSFGFGGINVSLILKSAESI